MRDSGIRKIFLEFMYEVSHKDSKKKRAQSATLGYHPQDVNTAVFEDPWV